MPSYADVPRPERDKIETVEQSQVYAYDPNQNKYVPLSVNADGELEVDASAGGAVDISDRDGRDLGNVDVVASPLTAAFKKNAGDPIMVEHDGVIDVSSRDDRNLGDVDVTASPLDAALKSNGTDPLLIEANATLPTEQQSPVGVEREDGTQIDPATEQTVSSIDGKVARETTLNALSNALDSKGTDHLLVQQDSPLDVSGAVVTITPNAPLDASAAKIDTDPDTDDAAFLDSVALTADGQVTISLSAQGADALAGRVVSSGQYDVTVTWQDDQANDLFTEEIATAVAGGTKTDLGDIPAVSPYAVVTITDTSSAAQTATASAHLR